MWGGNCHRVRARREPSIRAHPRTAPRSRRAASKEPPPTPPPAPLPSTEGTQQARSKHRAMGAGRASPGGSSPGGSGQAAWRTRGVDGDNSGRIHAPQPAHACAAGPKAREGGGGQSAARVGGETRPRARGEWLRAAWRSTAERCAVHTGGGGAGGAVGHAQWHMQRGCGGRPAPRRNEGLSAARSRARTLPPVADHPCRNQRHLLRTCAYRT